METNVQLTSAEIGSLWSAYQSDSMAIQVLNYAMNHVKDEEIRSILQYALDLSQKNVTFIQTLFTTEQIAVPEGYSNQDVNINAAPLYTDDFFLLYIQNLGKLGMNAYTLALSNAARSDVFQFFKQSLSNATELLDQAVQIKLSKGIFTRPPYIPYPQMIEYVNKQNYLSGGWFSDKRPLNAIEITNLYFNVERNTIGKALITGFSQVAASKEVRQFMSKGRDISRKHTDIFSNLLREDYLTVPVAWDAQPTDSTEAPFSDKLMMFHILTMNASGIGEYGTALGVSERADLSVTYTRLTAEIAKFLKDGADIMINNGWMEKPPQAADRKQIAKG
ncbi:DUF3231 family protein [Virgibacillus sp. W0181]|uniref:DUF3231 family protein n=1 Tax=Virgibacillus sp. W0181 TaxID=3391581 RepID=UPI003F4565FA